MEDFSAYLDGILNDSSSPNILGESPSARQPLSVRNNNPGNMRPVGAGSGFQKFDTPEAGIDAMHKDLFAKITGNSRVMKSKFGSDYSPTISNLISTWAPSSENDTQSYIDAVSKHLGKKPGDVLTADDIPQLSQAMIQHEGGGKASSYFGPGKEYASADTGIMSDATQTDLPDLSKLSDEELDALEAKYSQPKLPDLSNLSDEQLDQLEAQVSLQDLPGLSGVPNVGMPKMPVDNTPQVPFMGVDGKPMPQAPKMPTDDLMLRGTVKPDFIDRTVEDWQSRNDQAAEIMAANHGGPGGQSVASHLFQTAGNIGGRGVDLAGNIIGSGMRYAGDRAPETVKNIKDILGEVKEDAAGMASPGFKDAGDYIAANPEFRRNLSAANDLAVIAPAAKPAMGLVGVADDALLASSKKAYGLIPERKISTPVPTADELHATASETFKKLPLNEVALQPDGTNKFLSEIKALTPQTEAGKIVSGDSTLTKLVDRMSGKVDPETGEVVGGLKDRSMTLAEAQEIDEALGDHVDNLTDATTGRVNKQGKKVLDIQNAFRKAVFDGDTSGGDQLKLGRAQWAQAIRMRDIEKINNRAEMTENPITARKTGYRNLALKLKKNSMGYTPQEIALINRAAKSGIATNVLKLMGSRLGPLMAGAAGSATAGPLGAALGFGTDYAIAGTARAAADKLHLARDTAVKRAIANRKMPEVRPVKTLAIAPQLPAAPKLLTYQPEYVAGSGANAVSRPMTPVEQVAAEAARKRQVDLGLAPQPALRRGAVSSSGSRSANLEGKPGNLETRPTDISSLGTQTLEPSSNSATWPEPSGKRKIAQKSPESYRGPVINRSDIESTSIDTKPVYHDFNDTSTLLDKAKENLEPTLDLLNQSTAGLKGAKVMGARIKDPETLALKIKEKGRNPDQISDYLGSRVKVDDHETAAQVIDNIANKAEILHEDNFMSGAGRAETGYRAIHLQVKGKDGFSHEVQLVPRELMDVYDQERVYHDKWKDFRGKIPKDQIPEYEADMTTAKKIFDDAWAKYEKRTSSGNEGSPIQMHVKGKPDVAVTPRGDEIKVQHAIVEGKDLIASQHDNMSTNADYPQTLQPRDRSRFSSHQQIANLSKNLNPRLLMDSPLSSDGSPIISKDGIVESGNGRILAIRKAFTENPASTAKYKQALRDAGYNIDAVKNPILVRIRETPMNMKERVNFTQASNERSTAGMSATEQAKKDATKISSDILERFRGGDIKALKNREFVRAIVKDVIPENEQASILSKDGGLSQEGEKRISNALLNKAYDDENISKLLTESTDNELSSLGKALTNAAPAWAKIKDLAKSGAIPRNMDITPAITDLTKWVVRAKREGNPLSDYIRTEDILDKMDPRTKALIEALYNKELTRMRSADKITKFLTNYARKAEQTAPEVNLFGEKPMQPDELLDSALKETFDDDQTSGT